MLERAAAHCQSEAGRRRLHASTPASEQAAVEILLDETGEGIHFWQHTLAPASVSLSAIPETRAFLAAFQEGIVPEREDILALGRFLQVSEKARKLFREVTPEKSPRLASLTAGFADLSALLTDYTRIFSDDAEVRDGASRQLKELRRDLSGLMGSIEGRIRGLIRHRTPALADDIHLSIRNNRMTVNVPIGMLSQFKGMVVDYSSSGASVYVEPGEVVEMNNERQQLFLAEEMEVRRIIQEYSSSVQEHRDELLGNYETLAELDEILGRARYSISFSGVRPAVDPGGSIILKQARHPLMLEGFVPEDFTFDEERIAIVSGVNAGGKSVLLKTAGLFSLMAYCGIFVPAQEGTTIGMHDGVFVQIGDEQSVLNNLSTFTAHVAFLREMLSHLEARPADSPLALVLMDELGTGTDPREGSALGYALLERLRELPAKVIVTTHYDLIKTLGERYPDCKNFSLAFDEENLRPSYRVLDGIPGSSFAFHIARSQGLSEKLLTRAVELAAGKEEAFADVVETLRRKQQALEGEQQQARRERISLQNKAAQADEERAKLLEREAQLRKQISELKRDFEVKTEEFISQAKKRLREKLRESRGRSGLEVASEFSAEVQSKRESALAGLERELGIASTGAYEGETVFAVGQNVPLPELGVTGEVMAVDQQRHIVELNIRGKIMKLSFAKAAEMMHTPSPRVSSSAKHLQMSVADQRRLRAMGQSLDAENTGTLFTTAHQLDLHGHTTEEALPKLEKFLSDAILNNFDAVMIMHGVGTGALKKFVWEWLRSSRNVARFREATAEEGGKGITIATLK